MTLQLSRTSLCSNPRKMTLHQPFRIKRSFLMQLMIAGVFILGSITGAQADPINLALTGTATQSSTWYSPVHTSGANNAIDGKTDGNMLHNSVTHTQWESKPWWQVDLLSIFDLDQIVLWNRTDACSDRLSDFNVSVLDNSNTTIWTHDFFTAGGWPTPSLTIDLPGNILGEVVRVRLNGSQYLSLGEVQVFGTPVPEPGTMLLLASGLAGLAGVRRRFKK